MSEQNLKELLDRVLALGAAQGGYLIAETKGVNFAFTPNGYTLSSVQQQIDELADFPRRKAITVNVSEPASLLDYWTQHHAEDSRVFAYPTSAKIQACFDEHGGPEKQAQWRKHWCVLQMKKSDEFATWGASNKKLMDQTTFAEFLEDNAPDIIEPTAATFIECARDLKAKADVTFESKVNMASGSATFNFTENVSGQWSKGSIEIPERFKIAIQIYLGMPKVTIEARLRYRIASQKLTMWYDLYRFAQAERDAFEGVVKTLQEAIGKKILVCD